MASPDCICRLCGSATIELTNYIYLFGPLASDKKLHYKIAQLLDEAVGLSDNLPHFVCVLCANQLDSLWCFKNECHYTARTQLKHVVVQQNKKRSPDKITNNCRLCGLTSDQSINLFGPLASDEINMLQYKIIRLLDIAVSQNDNLSNFVCMLCVHKLDSLWCFKNMCHKIEMKLRKMSISYGAIWQNNKKTENNSSDASQNRIISYKTRENRSHTSDSNGIASVSKSSNICELSDSTVCSEDAKNSLSANNLEKEDEIKLPSEESKPNDTGSSSDDDFDNDDDDPDYDGNSDYYIVDFPSSSNMNKNKNENLTGISSENNIDISCSNYSLTVDELKESVSPSNATATQSDSKEVDDSTTVCENREMSSSKNTEITRDQSCIQQNQPSSSSCSSNSEPVSYVEGHSYKIDDIDCNSDLLCNRIPYLLVKSKMGSKHIIYTVLPDSLKFEYDHDYMLKVEHFYPKVYIRFNIEDSNVAKTLVQAMNNLLEGEISLMPYYFCWLNDENKLNISFRCFLCKQNVSKCRQRVINHISDHIHWICQACGKFCRTVSRLRHHMLQHVSHQYTCPTCNEITGSDLDEYNEHARSHYKFNCLPCKFQCTDEVKWLKHLNNDRKNSESCSSDCCLFYESFDELSNHVSALSALGGYVCGACGMAYHCEEYLKLHFQVHGLEHGNKTMGAKSQLKPSQKNLGRRKNVNLKYFYILKKIIANEIDIKEFQCTFRAVGGKVHTGFTCVKCNSNVTTEKKFRIHVENHISVTCYLCKKSDCKGISRFRYHIKRCGYKPRKCVSCRRDVWLKTSEEYLEHLTLHQKSKICIHCQQVFLTSQKLERHITKEHKTADSNKRQWFCEDCNETLIGVGRLYELKNKHLKEKHPHKLETFVCEICAKTYNSKCSLFTHFKNKHSTGKNNETFICAYCNKEFSIKTCLIAHIQKHMNEKKFECKICSKAFNRQSSLSKHKLDMHSVKKHQCKMCDKRFTYPSAMVDHMKRAHSFYVSKSKPTIP